MSTPRQRKAQRSVELGRMSNGDLVVEANRITGISRAVLLEDLSARGRQFVIEMVLTEQEARGRFA